MNEKIQLPQTQLTDFFYQKASYMKYPLSGTFELSPVCNFSCRMCYVRKTSEEVKRSPRPILKLDDWRRIAAEAYDAGMLYLLLTGGEPFMWPDFWTLYEELVKMGYLISINTNGSLINEKAAERLADLPPRKISITLYGASDRTYEKLCGIQGVLKKVDRAVTLLKQAGIIVRLNCSLTPYNQNDLSEIINYAKEKDVELSATSYMFPPIRRDCTAVGVNDARFTPEEAARYRLLVYKLQNPPELYKKLLEDICAGYTNPPGLDEGCEDPLDGHIRCRAGKASFWVTWDGWMTPCGMMPEPKTDLMKMSFQQAWQETVRKSEQLILSGSCQNCTNVHICHPCAAMAFAETGKSSGIPRYLCEISREMQRIAECELKTFK